MEISNRVRTAEVEKSDRTESASIRLKSHILKSLRFEAEQRQISFNTFVAQIFNQFLEWDSVAAKSNMISLPRAILIQLLEKMNDGEIIVMAQEFAKNQNKNLMLMLRNRYDVDSVLGVLEAWARSSGFSYRKEYIERNYKYIINHEMGKKWSLYLRTYFDNIFQDLGKKVIFEDADNMLAFTIDLD